MFEFLDRFTEWKVILGITIYFTFWISFHLITIELRKLFAEKEDIALRRNIEKIRQDAMEGKKINSRFKDLLDQKAPKILKKTKKLEGLRKQREKLIGQFAKEFNPTFKILTQKEFEETFEIFQSIKNQLELSRFNRFKISFKKFLIEVFKFILVVVGFIEFNQFKKPKKFKKPRKSNRFKEFIDLLLSDDFIRSGGSDEIKNIGKEIQKLVKEISDLEARFESEIEYFLMDIEQDLAGEIKQNYKYYRMIYGKELAFQSFSLSPLFYAGNKIKIGLASVITWFCLKFSILEISSSDTILLLLNIFLCLLLILFIKILKDLEKIEKDKK